MYIYIYVYCTCSLGEVKSQFETGGPFQQHRQGCLNGALSFHCLESQVFVQDPFFWDASSGLLPAILGI